jgi:probable addiction module antidote protein
MTEKISNFDVSEYLDDEKSIAAYLSAIMEENDPKLLLAAIGDIAKAKGMSRIAIESGLGRESLYKALNPEAQPRFDTIIRVLNSLGVSIGFNAKNKKANQMDRSKISRTISKNGGNKSPLSRRGLGVKKHAGLTEKA